MTPEEIKFRKMTETRVWKLVIQLAIPTVISMMITTIYNTADTFFVSRISVAASGATGIVFSLMAVLQAFGFMLGHGAGSNISRLLGARREEHASVFLSTSFFLALGVGLVIAIFGLAFLDALMLLLGSTETILPEAKAYARFILIAGPAMTAGCVLNNVLRYEGIAVYAMIGLTSGGILNMILDPILIFAFDLGTAGAGLATAISQYVSLALLLLPYLRGKTVTKISPLSFTHEISDIGNIILTGMPSMIRQGMTSIGTALLNIQASAYGDAAIAAFSIVNRCSGLLFSLALGLGQGFQPVSSYNYGAGRFSRVRTAYRFTLLTATGVLLCACLGCIGYAEGIVMLFRKEANVVQIGAQALRFACVGLIALPVSALGSMLFQSTGQKGRALLISFLQSGALFIPLLLILPRFLGLTGLELAQPAAYLIAAGCSLPICIHFLSSLREDRNLMP